ncbi:hypothetical protein ES703_78904 [subsurface metagenome]
MPLGINVSLVISYRSNGFEKEAKMTKLSEALKAGKFVITSEVGPPKGTNIEPALEEANHFGDKVIGINVTDLQSAVMRIGRLYSGLRSCLITSGLYS